MKRYFFRSAIFSLLVLGTTLPISATEWSWGALRDRVKSANRDVLVEGGMVQQARQKVLAEQSDLMPLRLGYSLMDLQPTSLEFLGLASHRFTVNQELPVTGRLEAQSAMAQSELGSRIASLDAMVRERSLALDKALVMYQVQARILENLQTQLELVQQLLLAAKIQYSTGKLSYSSLVSLQIKAADLEVEQKARDQARQESLLEVQELAGIDDPDFSVKVLPLAPPTSGWPLVDLASLVSVTSKDNPQKAVLLKGRDAALASVTWEEAKAYPDLGIMAETTFRGMDGALIFALGVDIGLPVLGAKGIAAKIEVAKGEAEVLERRVAAIDLALKKQLERLVRSRTANLAQIALLEEKAIRPGQENIAHMFREYQVQGTDLQAVVDAVFTSFELKNRYYELVAEVYGIDFELEALSGSENLVSRNRL